MKVSVAIALAASQVVIELDLPAGCTVADALEAAGVEDRFPELARTRIQAGIWSIPCEPSDPLREGDRVELYRGLQADAKEMRRARADLAAAARRLRTSTRSRNGR